MRPRSLKLREIKKNPFKVLPTSTAVAALACAVAAAPLSAQTTLFADTFDRPDSTDLNASTDGKSGTLGNSAWVQKGSLGGTETSGNLLKAGDNGAGAGWAFAYLDHNFVDALIAGGGGFSVTLDLTAYATAGATRHIGIAVGMSKTEAEGWSHNNPANLTYMDLFVGYRGNQSAIQSFKSGVADINNTSAGGPATLPKTLRIDFTLSDFNAGSTVGYTVTFGDVGMGTGSFTWSGTNENYIGIYTNLTARQARMDNFAITANADVVIAPTLLKIFQSGGNLDFEWNSLPGLQYDLVSSTDLATAPSAWPPYDDGVTTYQNILSSGTGTNTLTGVLKIGPARFFALVEEAIPPLFAENFESGDGGFTTSGTPNDWKRGVPNSNNGIDLQVTTGNGGSANCWGTNLGDGAGDGGFIDTAANSILRSPDIDLRGVTGAELVFAAAIDAAGTDTFEIMVKEVGTDALLDTIIPITLPATSTWADRGPFNLSAAAGKNAYLEFRFQGADNTYIGVYIDDVSITATTP